MNIEINLDNPRPFGPVLRTADRMRLEGCVNALTLEGLSLSLHCPHEALLDHYVRLMLTKLREAPESNQVEVYFPSNTESLLERFNAALSDQSISDATRTPRDSRHVRVWVVHDAQKVSAPEMQLLARLIHNFPGASIRALLLFHGTEAEPDALQAFGRKLLRWHIDLPTEEQAADALEMAEAEGRQAQMSQLLRRIGCLPRAQAATPLSLGLEAQEQRLEEARFLERQASPVRIGAKLRQLLNVFIVAMLQASQGLRQFKPQRASVATPAVKKLAVGSGLAVVLSLALMAWIQPKSFVAQKDKPAVSKTPEAPPQSEPAVDSAPKKQGPVGMVRAHLLTKS
jgi:hypothetical protein